MKRISSALLVASSLIVSTSIANADQFVRMVSGPSGGSWYPLGAKVMQVMESEIKGISTSNTSGVVFQMFYLLIVVMPKSVGHTLTLLQTDTTEKVSSRKHKKM